MIGSDIYDRDLLILYECKKRFIIDPLSYFRPCSPSQINQRMVIGHPKTMTILRMNRIVTIHHLTAKLFYPFYLSQFFLTDTIVIKKTIE